VARRVRRPRDGADGRRVPRGGAGQLARRRSIFLGGLKHK
jgi:hypothetical protein